MRLLNKNRNSCNFSGRTNQQEECQKQREAGYRLQIEETHRKQFEEQVQCWVLVEDTRAFTRESLSASLRIPLINTKAIRWEYRHWG